MEFHVPRWDFNDSAATQGSCSCGWETAAGSEVLFVIAHREHLRRDVGVPPAVVDDDALNDHFDVDPAPVDEYGIPI